MWIISNKMFETNKDLIVLMGFDGILTGINGILTGF